MASQKSFVTRPSAVATAFVPQLPHNDIALAETGTGGKVVLQLAQE